MSVRLKRGPCSSLRPPVDTSAAEAGSDLVSLIGRKFPASVGDALPSLVAKPLANDPVADAQFGRKLPRSDGLGHSAIVASAGSPTLTEDETTRHARYISTPSSPCLGRPLGPLGRCPARFGSSECRANKAFHHVAMQT